MENRRTANVKTGDPARYSVFDKGLSTTMNVDRDISGKPVRESAQMLRMKKWQVRISTRSSVQRNLLRATLELNRLADALSIPPPVKEEAALLYRRVLGRKLVRGRRIAAMVAASLYAACRLRGVQRSLDDVARACFVDKKNVEDFEKKKVVARYYRLIARELGIRSPSTDPVKQVLKIAAKIGVSGATQGVAVQMLKEAGRLTVGKNPRGLAAAALYLACLQTRELKTQNEIANAAGVTEVTLRNRVKDLKRAKSTAESAARLKSLESSVPRNLFQRLRSRLALRSS